MTLGRIAGAAQHGDGERPALEGMDLVEDEIEIGGVAWRLLRPRSAEALISQDDYDQDERLPYWAELWPSGRILADRLCEADLAGRRVLELGSGIAIPSLVAASRGAEALATDWYPDALAVARENARRNLERDLPTMVVDWFAPPPELLLAGPFEHVVAADVCYEERNAFALADLLPLVVAPTGVALVADPGRPYMPDLVDLLTGSGWSHEAERHRVPYRLDESGPNVTVHVFRPPEG